jgi:hypothetical protein
MSGKQEFGVQSTVALFRARSDRLTGRLAQHVALQDLTPKAAGSAGGCGTGRTARVRTGALSLRSSTSDVESNREGFVQLASLLGAEASDVVSQHRLRQTHKLIAVNAAVVLQTLVNPDSHLGTEPVVA